MKTITFVIQSFEHGQWKDHPFDLPLQGEAVAKIAHVRKSNPELKFRLVRRVTIVTDKPIKEAK